MKRIPHRRQHRFWRVAEDGRPVGGRIVDERVAIDVVQARAVRVRIEQRHRTGAVPLVSEVAAYSTCKILRGLVVKCL